MITLRKLYAEEMDVTLLRISTAVHLKTTFIIYNFNIMLDTITRIYQLYFKGRQWRLIYIQ
jgi:hypothetical protein